jgi:hypothetical protein
VRSESLGVGDRTRRLCDHLLVRAAEECVAVHAEVRLHGLVQPHDVVGFVEDEQRHVAAVEDVLRHRPVLFLAAFEFTALPGPHYAVDADERPEDEPDGGVARRDQADVRAGVREELNLEHPRLERQYARSGGETPRCHAKHVFAIPVVHVQPRHHSAERQQEQPGERNLDEGAECRRAAADDVVVHLVQLDDGDERSQQEEGEHADAALLGVAESHSILVCTA